MSPSLVQDLRSGKKDNLTFKNFSNLMNALGYDIILEKRAVEKVTMPKQIRMKAPSRRIRCKNAKC